MSNPDKTKDTPGLPLSYAEASLLSGSQLNKIVYLIYKRKATSLIKKGRDYTMACVTNIPRPDIYRIHNCKPGTVLVVRGKHEDRYMDASSLNQAGRSALKLMKERFTQGWYRNTDYTKVSNILDEHRDGKDRYAEALLFILSRSDWEYEHVELVTLEKPQ